jgi:hypothetical protein
LRFDVAVDDVLGVEVSDTRGDLEEGDGDEKWRAGGKREGVMNDRHLE